MRSWLLLLAGCASTPPTRQPTVEEPRTPTAKRRPPVENAPANPPINILPSTFESHLLVGHTRVDPDDTTRAAVTPGQPDLVGSYKLCIDEMGLPTTIEKWKSTGFADYDAKIEREMWGWQFRPYVVDGRPIAVCSGLLFVYRVPKS